MTMGKIMDAIERVMFGASAAEAVELRVRLAEHRLERRLLAGLEADAAADEAAEDADESKGSADDGK